MEVLQSKGEPGGGGLDKVLWWVRKRSVVWDPDTCHQRAASRWDWAERRRHCRKCWPGAGRELVGVVGTVRRRSGHHREGCKYEGIVGGQGWTWVLTTARTHCCSGGPGQWRPGSWGSWQPRGRSSPLSPHSRVWGASGRSFWRSESLLRGGSCQRSSSLPRRWHRHLREMMSVERGLFKQSNITDPRDELRAEILEAESQHVPGIIILQTSNTTRPDLAPVCGGWKIIFCVFCDKIFAQLSPATATSRSGGRLTSRATRAPTQERRTAWLPDLEARTLWK